MSLIVQPQLACQPLPQFLRGRKAANELLNARGEIKLDDVGAVGGVSKFDAQHLGVVLGLLQAGVGGLAYFLGLHHGNLEIPIVTQDVIGD